MPRFIGLFTVVEQVNPGAYRLELPSSYEAAHDVFNESTLRPWFSREASRTFYDELTPVLAHPALNKVVQGLDWKRYNELQKTVMFLIYQLNIRVCVEMVLQSGCLEGISPSQTI
jgi:hypothetical protein